MAKSMAKSTNSRLQNVTPKPNTILPESPVHWCEDRASGGRLVVSHVACGPVEAEFTLPADANRFHRVIVWSQRDRPRMICRAG
jgi:hypothetical protein